MALPSARLRHKFRSGNSWWKPIVHILRPFHFGVNDASLLIPASWPNRSRVHERFRWRNWRKPRPKPRKSSFGLIEDEGNVSAFLQTAGSAGCQHAELDSLSSAI